GKVLRAGGKNGSCIIMIGPQCEDTPQAINMASAPRNPALRPRMAARARRAADRNGQARITWPYAYRRPEPIRPSGEPESVQSAAIPAAHACLRAIAHHDHVVPVRPWSQLGDAIQIHYFGSADPDEFCWIETPFESRERAPKAVDLGPDSQPHVIPPRLDAVHLVHRDEQHTLAGFDEYALRPSRPCSVCIVQQTAQAVTLLADPPARDDFLGA